MGSWIDRIQQVGAYVLAIVYFFPVFLQVVYRALCSREKSKTVETPVPAVLNDPKLGTHGYVVANGIRFHYIAKGPETAPLMLCLHGFPESPYSWRYILQAFSNNYRVVAVSMRGYGETVHAEPSYAAKEDYSMPRLVEDVRSLIEALGYSRCVLVAHDWGGFIAWNYAYAHPATVDRLIIMNAPHPLAFRATMSITQLLRSFYMFVFQLPVFPEIWLRSGNCAFLRGAFLDFPMGVRRKDGPLSLNEDDMEVYMWTMQRAGTLTAAVNYYRNIFGKNVEYMRTIGVKSSNTLRVPTLLIWGREDAALGPESPQATGRYCSDFTLAMIENASHWVQQDAVEEVIAQMAVYLKVATLPVSRVTGHPALPPIANKVSTTDNVITTVLGDAGGGAASLHATAQPVVLDGHSTDGAHPQAASASVEDHTGAAAATAGHGNPHERKKKKHGH